jgi:hypothetical protein
VAHDRGGLRRCCASRSRWCRCHKGMQNVVVDASVGTERMSVPRWVNHGCEVVCTVRRCWSGENHSRLRPRSLSEGGQCRVLRIVHVWVDLGESGHVLSHEIHVPVFSVLTLGCMRECMVE